MNVDAPDLVLLLGAGLLLGMVVFAAVSVGGIGPAGDSCTYRTELVQNASDTRTPQANYSFDALSERARVAVAEAIETGGHSQTADGLPMEFSYGDTRPVYLIERGNRTYRISTYRTSC